MKKYIFLFIFVLCLSLFVSAEEKAEWTVMVYIAGDNNLDSALVQDVNEMEAVGSVDGKLNIIVLFDRWSGEWVYGQEGVVKTNESNSGLHIYYIKKDEDGVNRNIISDEITEDFGFENGIFDSGKPANLEKFIKAVIKKYPAKNYHLDIGTHGAGVKGVIVDDNAGSQGAHNIMSIKDLRDTLGRVFAKVVNKIAEENQETIKLNVLSFDACLMGMYEIQNDLAQKNVGYVVSSEEVIPGHGFSYNDILDYLKTRAELNAGVTEDGKGYSEKMVDSYYNAYNGKAKACLSSVDLKNLEEQGVNAAVAQVFKAINDNLKETPDENVDLMISFHNALYNTVYFSDDTFIDLIHFLEKLKEEDDLKDMIGEEVINNAINTINNSIVKNVAMGPQAFADNANGISIYLPYYYRVKKDGTIRRRSFREYVYYVNGLLFAQTDMGKEINKTFDAYINAMEVLPDSAFNIESDEAEETE